MDKRRAAYPAEFRARMVELVKAGRTPEELAREFEPTARSIIDWVARADRDAGLRQVSPIGIFAPLSPISAIEPLDDRRVVVASE
ncbi:transposase [Trinickia sp. LjRoot230]|uniref:transposase n=1 Tax=Trinickia sp. LjRoot230 TaxID=3342288 RepID=UPI003F506C0F